MRLGIVSDIHDHVRNLDRALPFLAERAEALVCLGDLCAPFVLARLARGFAGEIHVVFGNNDGDAFRMMRVAREQPHVRLHGEFFAGKVGGCRVALTHFPEVAAELDVSRFELVAYGHDHRPFVGASRGACVVDPGSLMGFDPAGGGRFVEPTFALFDAGEGRAELWRLPEGGGPPVRRE